MSEAKNPFGLCGCGKPARYVARGESEENACNKYGRCPTWDEQAKTIAELKNALQVKEMKEPTGLALPCDEACPKCGNLDINRKWYGQGDRIDHDRFSSVQPPASKGRLGSWKAEIEHLSNKCRCCGYWWASNVIEGMKDE